jgi:hypothetical protein
MVWARSSEMTTRRGALAGIVWSALPFDRLRAEAKPATRGQRLAGLSRDRNAARRIAAAFLADIGESDCHRAALDLDIATTLRPMDSITETQALRTFLGARIRADFATGAVIAVDGWLLSRTEVGACLLVAGDD